MYSWNPFCKKQQNPEGDRTVFYLVPRNQGCIKEFIQGGEGRGGEGFELRYKTEKDRTKPEQNHKLPYVIIFGKWCLTENF